MSDLAIFASDLHGNRFAYEKLFNLAIERKVDHVILGGDLTPKWPIIDFNKCIIPYDPKNFRFDDNGITLSDYLKSLESKMLIGLTKAKRYYLNLGGYNVYAGKTQSLSQLLQEQLILKRMCDSSINTHMAVESGAGLTSTEWRWLEALIHEAINSNHYAHLKKLMRNARFQTLGKNNLAEAIDLIRVFVELKRKASPAVNQLLSYYDLSFNDLSVPIRLDNFSNLCRQSVAHHCLQKLLIENLSISPQTEKAQAQFLNNYFAKQVKMYKKARPQGRVYLILGNDDTKVCLSVVNRMHKQGSIISVQNSSHELADGYKIAGYPNVRDSNGRFYDFWEKSETEILNDLLDLEQKTDPKITVYIVHTPPANCSLDHSFQDQHFGSVGVRDWLETGPKHLVLSGHIHEAPFINGRKWQERIAGTLCMQPGGWHDEALCAIIFKISNPSKAEWTMD